MLVVDVPVPFFLGWPAKVEILALLMGAFPGTRMGFLVFCKITWSFELLLAVTARVHNIPWLV